MFLKGTEITVKLHEAMCTEQMIATFPYVWGGASQSFWEGLTHQFLSLYLFFGGKNNSGGTAEQERKQEWEKKGRDCQKLGTILLPGSLAFVSPLMKLLKCAYSSFSSSLPHGVYLLSAENNNKQICVKIPPHHTVFFIQYDTQGKSFLHHFARQTLKVHDYPATRLLN